MSGAATPAITLLLCTAALLCVLCVVALVAVPGFYDKLHYLAPPAILGTAAIVAALLIEQGFNSAGIKALLVLLILCITNPVLTYAAARAHLVRESRKQRNGEASGCSKG